MPSKLQRMEYLGEVIKKYLITEPKLTLEDIAIIFSSELSDNLLGELIKIYKKQNKNKY